MKQQMFRRNLIATSIALSLGVSGLAIAATTGDVSPTTNPTVKNQATATYSVGNVKQPEVKSNEVTVTVAPVAKFSLVGTQGVSANDDINENIAVVPGGTVTFENKLSNDGNESDTYTLNLQAVNDGTITTDETDEFAFTSTPDKMTVKIYKDSDTNQSNPTTQEINNGGTITLEADEYAIISYTATAPDSAKGGETDTLTLSATSKNIGAITTAKQTLKNESQALVKLPVFKIEKSASTSNVNLNKDDVTFNYVIKVTNDGSATYAANADNILVQDKLPAGLIVKDSATDIQVDSPNATKGTVSVSDSGDQKVVSVNGANLDVGQTMTITIPVKIKDEAAKKELAKNGSVNNYADVYDNFDNSPVNDPSTADIHDSTNTKDPQKTHLPDEHDSTDPNQPGGDDSPDDDTKGNPGKVSFTDRNVELTGESTEELPPTASGANAATYTHDISNKGNETEKGLTFTITNNNGDKVKVKNVRYEDPDGASTPLTAETDGSYKLPDLPASKTGKIIYDVETNEADPTDTTPYATTVTVKPAGTDAPTVPAKTDKTTVKTLQLVKEQALDANCDGVAEGTFVQTDLNAKPGNCIIYQITATNAFTKKAMTGVEISDSADKWKQRARYNDGSAKVTIGTGNITEHPVTTGSQDSGAVKATFATIAANNQGQIQFSIKIKP